MSYRRRAHLYGSRSIANGCAEKGWSIKVETQGASGIENELNSADIENADMVILTNDISIKNEGRFNHKKLSAWGLTLLSATQTKLW